MFNNKSLFKENEIIDYHLYCYTPYSFELICVLKANAKGINLIWSKIKYYSPGAIKQKIKNKGYDEVKEIIAPKKYYPFLKTCTKKLLRKIQLDNPKIILLNWNVSDAIYILDINKNWTIKITYNGDCIHKEEEINV